MQAKFNEAWALRNKGNSEEVLLIAEQYLKNSKTPEDKALFLKLYAQVYSDTGRLREALAHYKEIERIYIQIKDEAKQMHALRHVGDLYHQLGEFECAQKCLVQVVDYNEEHEVNILEKANTHRVYALAVENSHNASEAKVHWQKGESYYAQLGIEEGVNECRDHLE
ncbi:hypothetical protein BFP97_08310 [Roseivirga sp. 4D4]|nr:hypothetical protein BFP97_08310 [Roseivirga sp. 4D4]